MQGRWKESSDIGLIITKANKELSVKIIGKFCRKFLIVTIAFMVTKTLMRCMSIDRKIFFFYLGFLSRTFTNHRTAGEGGGHFSNSSLPLPPASQALRHQPGDHCGGLTSAHSQQPDSNREFLLSERKSLTTKLRTINFQKTVHILAYYSFRSIFLLIHLFIYLFIYLFTYVFIYLFIQWVFSFMEMYIYCRM